LVSEFLPVRPGVWTYTKALSNLDSPTSVEPQLPQKSHLN
jgi:hypothetical protein